VLPANDPPIANPQNLVVAEDGSVNVTLSGSDLDGDALAFSVVSGPTSGTLSGAVPNLTYSPAANFSGNDQFVFRVTDPSGTSSTAAVSLAVIAVNDAPVANAQSVSTPASNARAITLTGSDVEGSALTYTVLTTPAHGTLGGTAPNLTYTPTAGYSGPDSFTFRVNDGAADSATATVSITVTAPTSVPAAPNGLVATAVSTSRIDLTWNDNSNSEDGFKIERSTNNSSFTEIGTVGPGVRNFSSMGLASNKTYYYRVRAYNTLGNSAYSNTASAKTLR
jgi:predicted phage tail protein